MILQFAICFKPKKEGKVNHQLLNCIHHPQNGVVPIESGSKEKVVAHINHPRQEKGKRIQRGVCLL